MRHALDRGEQPAAARPESTRVPDPESAFDQLSGIDPDGDLDMADDTLSDSAFFTDLLSDSDTDVDMRFAGMLDRDIDALDEYTVADAMTTAVQTISPDEDATAAARLMGKTGVHRLLVVDHDRIAGIISTSDLTRAVAERRLPDPTAIVESSTDFDTGWSHEPVVPYDDGLS